MRKAILTVLFLILMLSAGSGVLAQTSKQVSAIDAKVRAINKNLNGYTRTKKDVADVSLEGTEAIYYVSGKGLKKITAHIYGETYNGTASLYFQGEEMIFAYFKYNRYDTQVGLEKPPKVIHTEVQRFYYANGEVIKQMLGKREVKISEAIYRDNKMRMGHMAEKLKAGYGQ